MILKTDCRHFPGDRPCTFNKTQGVMCDDCPHYDVIDVRILIIKLDAIGDVLRTTSILHGLKEKYAKSEITWVTRQSAAPLFENNVLVDRVFLFESTEAVLTCAGEEFDVVINLDAGRESALLASQAKGTHKFGFGLDTRGHIFPFNDEAVTWLEMGAFDQKKKQNTRSYQDLMLEICGIETKNKGIILSLSEKEKGFAAEFAKKKSLSTNSTIIGINTGASPRWQYKQWTMEGFTGLVRMIVQKTNWMVLLYGGPHEVGRNKMLAGLDQTRIIDTGTNNKLREFFALVTLCDVFLTGDTLALHVATALGKKVVAYFGPTSAHEIEPYGNQIVKVQSDLDCLVCYKPRCDFNPHCMNSITPDRMFSALQASVKSLRRP